MARCIFTFAIYNTQDDEDDKNQKRKDASELAYAPRVALAALIITVALAVAVLCSKRRTTVVIKGIAAYYAPLVVVVC